MVAEVVSRNGAFRVVSRTHVVVEALRRVTEVRLIIILITVVKTYHRCRAVIIDTLIINRLIIAN